MTQTPLQEALSKLGMMRQAENENVRIALNANEVAVMLNSLLPNEKEFISKVWNAAAIFTNEENKSYDGHKFKYPDKQQFIDKLYKPKQ